MPAPSRLHPAIAAALAPFAPPPAPALRRLCPATRERIQDLLALGDDERDAEAERALIPVLSELLGEPIVRDGRLTIYADIVDAYRLVAEPDVAGAWELLDCVLRGDPVLGVWLSRARALVAS